jgi:Zn-finger nucleic acid-binding protein
MLFDMGELQQYAQVVLGRHDIDDDVFSPGDIDQAIAFAFSIDDLGVVVGNSPDCCPKHGAQMLLVQRSGGGNVEMDICPVMGCVWFDGGVHEERTIPEIVAYIQAILDQYRTVVYQTVTYETYWTPGFYDDPIFWW